MGVCARENTAVDSIAQTSVVSANPWQIARGFIVLDNVLSNLLNNVLNEVLNINITNMSI